MKFQIAPKERTMPTLEQLEQARREYEELCRNWYDGLAKAREALTQSRGYKEVFTQQSADP